MDAEQRFIMILTLIALILLFLVCLVLLLVLWPLRELIGIVLLSIFILMVLLVVGITINEQVLRHRRVKYQQELPLNAEGQPLYLYQDMKAYREHTPRFD